MCVCMCSVRGVCDITTSQTQSDLEESEKATWMGCGDKHAVQKDARRGAETKRKTLLDGEGMMHLEAERGEEPLVLARRVLLLEDLLDLLLGVLALRRLLESVLGDGALEALELESVTGGHEVVVRDDLDKRLDLGALGDLLGPHALGHLLRVSLNTGSDNVRERLVLGAVIELLDDDNLCRIWEQIWTRMGKCQ